MIMKLLSRISLWTCGLGVMCSDVFFVEMVFVETSVGGGPCVKALERLTSDVLPGDNNLYVRES